ncbi:MAG TPA: hypothetical protein VGL63_13850 [Streptosporangiaceae bacterium]
MELQRDGAALIALWLAIHGGDPAPIQISPATALLAAALVAQLGEEAGEIARPLSAERLSRRMAPFGLRVETRDFEASGITTEGGGLVCVRGDDGAPGCCVRMPFVQHLG